MYFGKALHQVGSTGQAKKNIKTQKLLHHQRISCATDDAQLKFKWTHFNFNFKFDKYSILFYKNINIYYFIYYII